MKTNKLFFIFLAFLVIIINLFLYLINNYFLKNKENILQKEENFCKILKSEKEINGDSMQPLLKNQETVVLLENYYNCYEVKRGDIVAYKRSSNKNPLIKIVKVLGGDSLVFENNGKLVVNGEVMKNSQNIDYVFSSKEIKMISLYIENGYLQDDAYLIFGDNVSSSMDSRKFGAVGENGFLGKFELN